MSVQVQSKLDSAFAETLHMSVHNILLGNVTGKLLEGVSYFKHNKTEFTPHPTKKVYI